MRTRIVDVDLENFHLLPKRCTATVFWELMQIDAGVDAAFEKEEWFSSTLLEWGRCGKLVMEDGEALGFAEYAPAPLFPRLAEFSAGRASDDAAYLAYCYVEDRRRGRGLGSEIVRDVARDLVDRGYRAVECIGDRQYDPQTWVLPFSFLTANGFQVLHEDPRYPLLRLDLHEIPTTQVHQESAFVPIPSA